LTTEEEENGMNARIGLILSVAAMMTGSGCAAGGGAPSAPATRATPTTGGTVLEEGIRPRDNDFTREAERALDRGLQAEEGAEADALFQQALDAALAGIAADSTNPKSYYQAALASMKLGEYLTAAEMFDQAEALHPRYILETEGWREQGWIDAYNDAIGPLNAGDMETAADFLEAADALYSARPEALLQLGTVYTRMGRYDEAAGAFRRALDVLDETQEAAMMDTAAAGVWEEHEGYAIAGLGQAYQFSGRYAEAAEIYGQMLEDDPDNTQVLGNLATVLTEMEMADSVDALYNNLLSRPGLTAADYTNAGVGLFRIDQFERAAEAFKAAAAMSPLNRDARVNLVQTYFAAEDWQGVVDSAPDCLALDPLNGYVWIYLTRAYSELDQPEEANRVFNEYQALGYEVDGLMVEPLPGGGTRVTGGLKNNTAEEGTTVTLRFHFGDADGQELGTTDIRIQVPAPEETIQFSGTFQSSTPVGGYRYEVVQ